MSDIQKPTGKIKEFVTNLIAENARLKNKIDQLEARIAGGVRVYAKVNANGQLSYVSNYPAPDIKLSAATLLLDEQGGE